MTTASFYRVRSRGAFELIARHVAGGKSSYHGWAGREAVGRRLAAVICEVVPGSGGVIEPGPGFLGQLA